MAKFKYWQNCCLSCIGEVAFWFEIHAFLGGCMRNRLILAAALLGSANVLSAATNTRTENFNVDPGLGWDGRNNRATTPGPLQIQQNFGWSLSNNAGGL